MRSCRDYTMSSTFANIPIISTSGNHDIYRFQHRYTCIRIRAIYMPPIGWINCPNNNHDIIIAIFIIKKNCFKEEAYSIKLISRISSFKMDILNNTNIRKNSVTKQYDIVITGIHTFIVTLTGYKTLPAY